MKIKIVEVELSDFQWGIIVGALVPTALAFLFGLVIGWKIK